VASTGIERTQIAGLVAALGVVWVAAGVDATVGSAPIRRWIADEEDRYQPAAVDAATGEADPWAPLVFATRLRSCSQ
jgi:hypothetical protein